MEKFINRLGLANYIVITSIAVLIFLVSMSFAIMGKISDFPEYYAPSKMVIEGRGADSYIVSKLSEKQHSLFSGMKDRVVVLFVPPPGLAFISVIGYLKVHLAIVAWKTFNIGCLIFSVLFMKRIFLLNRNQTTYLAAAICFSYPCLEAFRLDQLAPLLLLAFSASLYFLKQNKNLAVGFCLSILIMLKPQQIIVFLAYLAGLNRWRPLAFALVIFLFFTLIAFFEIGAPGFHNYLVLIQAPESVTYMQPELNATLRGQLLRLFPSSTHEIFFASTIIYGAIVLFSYVYALRNRHNENQIFKGLLCVIPVGIITSLHCHDYDLLLLIPSLVVVFTDAVLPFSKLFKLAMLFASIPFLIPAGIPIHYEYLLHGGKINILFVELLWLTWALICKMVKFNQKNDTKAAPR